ncbi:hypothetical protein KFK09_015119 [Dendrobium nobile]|uniref:Uncharacterized protein n=1 Tax=Dendrobium nobile TaxID=94219 RepID=A0A8T3B3X5_DENNO|nr:hypothetical protein KFK09_015119 [Dendrobium nobile]
MLSLPVLLPFIYLYLWEDSMVLNFLSLRCTLSLYVYDSMVLNLYDSFIYLLSSFLIDLKGSAYVIYLFRVSKHIINFQEK